MNVLRFMFAAVAALALPLLVNAQTLPPSTIDRQQIANLTYQANLPGTSAADRLAIQRQIIQLQYQINTRAPIQTMPTAAPMWNGAFTSLQSLPVANPNASPVPLSATVYGSCEGDRAVIAYLNQQLEQGSLTSTERRYATIRRDDLVRETRARGC